jgi:hypothetical protein
MKHHRLATRIWLTTALTTVASFALVSGASAMRNATDPGNFGYARTQPSAVVTDSSGFNWGVAGIVAALAVAVVIVALAVVRSARNRGTLVPAH